MNGSECAVLAIWLMKIALNIAEDNPDCTHSSMVAAIFTNLVVMRKAASKANNPGLHATLLPENQRRLQQAAFLFRSAHNWLAQESIEKGLLLWRLRPKYHKYLVEVYAVL
ncbi:unnamed protein product [Durusdinium trenchii]|uniref:Uncharacterized protein n=1 Tax=Durusdinium trenchii TaxID=1381693 RepID=A0ABP0L1G7_9DINO